MFKRYIRWTKTHKLVSVVMLILILVAGFFIYEKIALELNKRAFAHARAAIDSVYADIVSQLGQPNDYKIYNTCSVQYGEFENGPMSCNINTDLLYSVINRAEANTKFKKMQQVFSENKKFYLISSMSQSLRDTVVASTNYHDAIDSYEFNHLECSAKYIYDTPSEITLTIKDPSQKSLQINIGCSGLARQAYYPLAN